MALSENRVHVLHEARIFSGFGQHVNTIGTERGKVGACFPALNPPAFQFRMVHQTQTAQSVVLTCQSSNLPFHGREFARAGYDEDVRHIVPYIYDPAEVAGIRDDWPFSTLVVCE